MSPNNNDWLLYNASEYTVNGKTYRNLEAEVLYNHNLSEQNAEDIDALEGRMDTAEEDIDALEGRMDTAEGRLDALGKTVKVAVMGETTFAQIKAWHDGNYTVIGTKPYTGNGHSYYILDNISPTQAKFVRVYDYVIGAYIVDDEDNWTFAYEDLASIDYVLGAIDDRIVTSVDATSDNLHVPSARALWQQAAKYAKCKRFVGTSTEGGPIYLLNNNIADIPVGGVLVSHITFLGVLKALLPMDCTPLPMVTECNLLQSRKALLPIEVTLSGMVMEVRQLQP